MDDHLQFPIQVMGQNGRQDIYAVTGFAPGRYVVHLDLTLEFGKQHFLGTATVVEPGDLAAARVLLLITTW